MEQQDQWNIQFPRNTVIGSGSEELRVKIDKLQPEHVEAAKQAFTQSVRSGKGIGKDEFTDAEIDARFCQAMKHNMTGGWAAFGITDDDGEFVATYVVYPCHLTRSSSPIYAAGYLAVQESHRSKGLSQNPDYQLVSWYSMYSQGYLGVIAKTSVMGKGIASGLGGAAHFGIIPHSLNMEKYGRVADLIVYGIGVPEQEKARDLLKRKEKEKSKLTLPQLVQVEDNSHLNVPINFTETKILVKSSKSVQKILATVTSAQTLADVMAVENLMRDLAERGDGFAMDEFDRNGCFNRRLLRRSHVITASAPDGSVIGGAIFGPSLLTRSITTTTLAAYIPVLPSIKEFDLQQRLLEMITSWAKSDGYEFILMDVYHTDYKMMAVVNKLGFVAVGTIPHSGYIRGHGLINCTLCHKYLVPYIQAGFREKHHTSRL